MQGPNPFVNIPVSPPHVNNPRVPCNQLHPQDVLMQGFEFRKTTMPFTYKQPNNREMESTHWANFPVKPIGWKADSHENPNHNAPSSGDPFEHIPRFTIVDGNFEPMSAYYFFKNTPAPDGRPYCINFLRGRCHHGRRPDKRGNFCKYYHLQSCQNSFPTFRNERYSYHGPRNSEYRQPFENQGFQPRPRNFIPCQSIQPQMLHHPQSNQNSFNSSGHSFHQQQDFASQPRFQTPDFSKSSTNIEHFPMKQHTSHHSTPATPVAHATQNLLIQSQAPLQPTFPLSKHFEPPNLPQKPSIGTMTMAKPSVTPIITTVFRTENSSSPKQPSKRKAVVNEDDMRLFSGPPRKKIAIASEGKHHPVSVEYHTNAPELQNVNNQAGVLTNQQRNIKSLERSQRHAEGLSISRLSEPQSKGEETLARVNKHIKDRVVLPRRRRLDSPSTSRRLSNDRKLSKEDLLEKKIQSSQTFEELLSKEQKSGPSEMKKSSVSKGLKKIMKTSRKQMRQQKKQKINERRKNRRRYPNSDGKPIRSKALWIKSLQSRMDEQVRAKEQEKNIDCDETLAGIEKAKETQERVRRCRWKKIIQGIDWGKEIRNRANVDSKIGGTQVQDDVGPQEIPLTIRTFSPLARALRSGELDDGMELPWFLQPPDEPKKTYRKGHFCNPICLVGD